MAALLAASCVYPFEPEGIVSQRRLVIEGDIIIGGETTIKVSATWPIIYTDDFDMSKPAGNAWIEDSEGNTYFDHTFGFSNSLGAFGMNEFHIDTRGASPDLKYRLVFHDYQNERMYESSWQEVVRAPQITDMSYDYDDSDVNIRMSVEGGDNQFFRWDYREDWEYHAEYAPFLTFDVSTGRVVDLGAPDYSHYWCYDKHLSSEFGLASTEKQSANRLDDQIITTQSRKELRFQTSYRMRVTVSGLNRDAYDYLHNMLEISDINGSLFSPSPDDMRGNIKCQQDSTEFVIGYISAIEQTTKQMYIPVGHNLFYKAPPFTPLVEPELGTTWTLLDYYMNGMRPVRQEMKEMSMVTLWGPLRCIDCRMGGGALKRPDDWMADGWVEEIGISKNE